jgi:pimeloyl-ACP methyl ester carboxylesterase
MRAETVDLPGHGESPPARDGLTIDDLAARLLALLDGLAIETAVVVGSSAGAMVALHLAVQAPARVAGLVLLGAQTHAETAQSRARYQATLRMAQRLGAAPVLRGLASVMFGAATRRARPELVAAWIEHNASLDPTRAMPVVHAILERKDAAPLLPRVRCPALVLHGAEDALVSTAAAADLAAALPRGRIVTVAGAGHLASIEQPDEVALHVAEFVDRIELS